MTLFESIRQQGISYLVTEEDLYAEVLREVESDVRRDGLWARALAESDMDNDKARAAYIRLRAFALKDEVSTFIAELGKAELENIRKRNDALQIAEQQVIQKSQQLEFAIAEASQSVRDANTLAAESMAKLKKETKEVIDQMESKCRDAQVLRENAEYDRDSLRKELFITQHTMSTYIWVTWCLAAVAALEVFLLLSGTMRVVFGK